MRFKQLLIATIAISLGLSFPWSPEGHAHTRPPPQVRVRERVRTDGFRACPSVVRAGMACVLGGAFTRGSDHGMRDERPRATISVDTFLLDLHEVTNAEYRPCIESGRCARPMPFRGYGRDAQPIVGISWYDARTHCVMQGKRLPTEAEFERALGGPETTTWPWGENPDPECVHGVFETENGKGCGRGTTWNVMSHPAGHFGVFDLAGNVYEWTNDWYSECYAGCANECGEACTGHNPQGPCDGSDLCPRARAQKVVRGGSWWHRIERSRASARRGSGAPNRGPHRFGFRCASDLESANATAAP